MNLQDTVDYYLKHRDSKSIQQISRELFEKDPSLTYNAYKQRIHRWKRRDETKCSVEVEEKTTPIKDLDVLDPFDMFDFPEGDYEVRHDYTIKGEKRILVINDVHIPYHVRPVVQFVMKYAMNRSVDVIVLNGDIVDFYQVSRWEKRPDKKKLEKEIEICRQFLNILRKLFPNVEIIYNEGNHEVRMKKYVINKCPDLFGLGVLETPQLLKLKEFGVRWLDEFSTLRAGDLNIIHGHEVRGGGVWVSATKFRKANVNLLFGHHHKTQTHTLRTMNDKIMGSWSVGCLCDLKPDYHPINDWTWGFAEVDLFNDGSFKVQNKKVEYVNGQLQIYGT